jgi:hypothetical protein
MSKPICLKHLKPLQNVWATCEKTLGTQAILFSKRLRILEVDLLRKRVLAHDGSEAQYYYPAEIERWTTKRRNAVTYNRRGS